MTQAFDAAVALVLEQEGGYANDPRDPGGETKYGISKRSYPQEDIAALTREHAIELYRRDYWDAVSGDALPAQLAPAVFDCAVNQGTRTAIVILQGCLGVAADGVIGPTTLAALKRENAETALIDFMAARALRYTHLAAFATFGLTWMRRLFAVQAACLRVG